MTKYLITMAYELEGHAGASAFYIQTDNRVDRAEKVKLINAALGKDAYFNETKYGEKKEGDMTFYGEMVIEFEHDGKTIKASDPVSISMVKLSSRMEKNKLYGVETRTG
jgi:hypothetical protein